eukprot:CAMPEP_0172529440 /NCGR_PEP_ID=MMETSP1067-20121228/3511_1 /TAXON_ID=265564 ORGANISM="Thalassiosira punctigera, Strain Tpunct2005C2" /NCGR_SAMPLE_ID=MMETSP1067 /ASSEMBLY_ACC=CAM_ASM_000444 /LENGTH=202 /DNA_ID=CAMNT_0013313489 /DNA_START=75 /DNA_END=683 /DNA_ORIENTATION=+
MNPTKTIAAFLAMAAASGVYSYELRGGAGTKLEKEDSTYMKVGDGFLPVNMAAESFQTLSSFESDGEDESYDFLEDMNDEEEEGNKCRFPKGTRTKQKGCKSKKFYCSVSGCPRKKGVQRGTCRRKKAPPGAGGAAVVVCGCNGKKYNSPLAARRAGVNTKQFTRNGKCKRANEDDNEAFDFDDDEEFDYDSEGEEKNIEEE